MTLSGADSVIRNNKGVNGSVLRMNSGKLKLNDTMSMTNNEALNGGVMHIKNAQIETATGKKLTLSNNKASNGGAIYVDNGSFKTDANIEIRDNIATMAGAIYFNKLNSYNVLVNNEKNITYKNNRAEYGATLVFKDTTGTQKVSSISIVDETSAKYGSIYAEGGSGTIVFDKATFTGNGNVNSVGGAFYVKKANVHIDKNSVFARNYNTIYNEGGTVRFVKVTGAHDTTITENTSNDIVFLNNLGEYVLSGNANATYELFGGIFKNTVSPETYTYKLTTPSIVTTTGNVNVKFSGNITFATAANIKNIYVTDPMRETFRIVEASKNMLLSYYVLERGTKVVDDIGSTTGFDGTYTYLDGLYPTCCNYLQYHPVIFHPAPPCK